MNKLTFTQNALVKSLEDTALNLYKAMDKGSQYGIEFQAGIGLEGKIQDALDSLYGRSLLWRGYIDGELKFEECLTYSIVEHKSCEFESECESHYGSSFELTIEQYDVETGEVLFKEERTHNIDRSPSITSWEG